MSKELIYNLPYRENGEKKSIEIKIDFLSRGIARDFDNLHKKQESLRSKWEELKSTDALIEEYKKEKPEGYKKELKELFAKSENLKIDILSFDKNTFIDDQYKLLQMILKDNGIKDGILLNNDFWEYQVDVQDMMTFLVAVIYKDIDLKKKH
ncbi:MAG: hypothetical protein PHE51_04940 [Eubacteriales bacterium]|nr:hypothetical protein [Eubacteriales bacterium]